MATKAATNSDQGSFTDMLAQMNALKEQMASQADTRLNEIREELETLRQVKGVGSIASLLGIREASAAAPSRGRPAGSKNGGTAKSAPGEAKYALDGQTWTGRGRQPGWYQEFIAGGGNADDILVKHDEPQGEDA